MIRTMGERREIEVYCITNELEHGYIVSLYKEDAKGKALDLLGRDPKAIQAVYRVNGAIRGAWS